MNDRVAARERTAGRHRDRRGRRSPSRRRRCVVRRRDEVEDARLVPVASSRSTTCDPMKPDPPVTRTFMHRLPSAIRPVVERHAPVVLGHPVRVRQVDRVPEDPVAGLVVDLARRALDRVEDDVLVEARDHAVGELQARRSGPGRGASARPRSSRRRSPSRRSVWTSPIAAVNSFRRKFRPCTRVVGLAVVAERARELDRPPGRRETSMPPSPVEIVFVGANDQMPASPQVPARRPFQSAPWAWAQSSIRKIPSARQSSAISLDLECEMAADVDEEDGARLVLAHLALEVRERHAEVVAVAVDELDVAPALIAASGVAMNVFDGQSTVSPRTPAYSSAASAAPDQPRTRPPRDRSRSTTPPRSSGSARPRTSAPNRGRDPRADGAARGRGGRSRSRSARALWRGRGSTSRPTLYRRPAGLAQDERSLN